MVPVKPLVTIACECGARGEVRLGGRHACACGAVFAADRGPAVQAAQDLGRRYRWQLAVSFLALLLVFATPLVALDRAAVLFVPVAALGTWYGTVRPQLEERYRAALAALPEWAVAT